MSTLPYPAVSLTMSRRTVLSPASVVTTSSSTPECVARRTAAARQRTPLPDISARRAVGIEEGHRDAVGEIGHQEAVGAHPRRASTDVSCALARPGSHLARTLHVDEKVVSRARATSEGIARSPCQSRTNPSDPFSTSTRRATAAAGSSNHSIRGSRREPRIAAGGLAAGSG